MPYEVAYAALRSGPTCTPVGTYPSCLVPCIKCKVRAGDPVGTEISYFIPNGTILCTSAFKAEVHIKQLLFGLVYELVIGSTIQKKRVAPKSPSTVVMGFASLLPK